jgi:hypothetical protein
MKISAHDTSGKYFFQAEWVLAHIVLRTKILDYHSRLQLMDG